MKSINLSWGKATLLWEEAGGGKKQSQKKKKEKKKVKKKKKEQLLLMRCHTSLWRTFILPGRNLEWSYLIERQPQLVSPSESPHWPADTEGVRPCLPHEAIPGRSSSVPYWIRQHLSPAPLPWARLLLLMTITQLGGSGITEDRRDPFFLHASYPVHKKKKKAMTFPSL